MGLRRFFFKIKGGKPEKTREKVPMQEPKEKRTLTSARGKKGSD